MKTTAALKASFLRDKMDDVGNYSDFHTLCEDVIEANFLEMKEAYRLGMSPDKIIHNILDFSTLPEDTDAVQSFMIAARIESVNCFIAWMKE